MQIICLKIAEIDHSRFIERCPFVLTKKNIVRNQPNQKTLKIKLY